MAMRKKDTKLKNVSPTRGEKKSGGFTRKIDPVQGGLVREMIRCGRPNCRCAGGSLHGPYHYRVWMVRGKRFKKYVRNSEKQAIINALSAYKQRRIEQRQADERNAQLVRQIRQDNKEFSLLLQLIRKGSIKL